MTTGSIVALVTPMQSDGAIDWPALAQLIEFHIDNGTCGLVVVGTTGESATLDVAEHESVIKFAVDQSGGRIPVIAGTGGNSTAEAIHLTGSAQRAGADAALIVTPYYNKPSQRGLLRHYQAIAEAVDLPQILYNVPGRTACDLLPDTVLQLSEVPNIVGIKEATGDIERAKYLLAKVPADFLIYSGDDLTGLDLLLAGGHGVISVTANVAPRTMAAMCEAAAADQVALAKRLDQSVEPLHRQLFVEANPVPVKWALHYMGQIDKGIRLPLVWMHEQFEQDVINALAQAKLV